MDFDPTIVLYEYTEFMANRRKNFSEDFFDMKPEENEAQAIAIIRTIVKSFLRCPTIALARQTVTMELLYKIKLERLLQIIKIPSSVDLADRDDYLIAKIFTNNFDEETWTANHLCARILDGTPKKFPKYYMDDAIGIKRASYCLNYLLTHDHPMAKAWELYRFSATPEFKVYLKKKLLLNVALKLYDTPVEFLHVSLQDDLKDEACFVLYNALYHLDIIGRYSLIAGEKQEKKKKASS